MAREKGIILKTRGNRCVVLTPGGEFRTVPRPAETVAPGQEIEFAAPAARSNWRVLLAAASLFVVLVAGTLFTSIFPAAGYVSVDINPSIELGMNAWGRVVRAQGLNGDGQSLLQSLPLYGSPLDQALDKIAQKAEAMHYLKPDDPDNTMVVTYTPGRLALVRLRDQQEAYQSLADQLKAEQTPAGLVFAQTTPAQRRAARSLGLSVGKYLVRERLMEKGLKIPVEQMARTSIAKLLKAEKMRLDVVMGPNTEYREVRLDGLAAARGQGAAVRPASQPAKAQSGMPARVQSGVPARVTAPDMSSSRQVPHRQAAAAQPSRFRRFLERIKEQLDAGGSGIFVPRTSGHAEKSGDSKKSGGSDDRSDGGSGQAAQRKMAPSGTGMDD